MNYRLFLPSVTIACSLFLIGCTGVPKGIEPVENFDVNRYMGTWYEIARFDHRFERGLSHVTAEYALREDGKVTVVNQGFSAQKERWERAEGVAQFRGADDVGSLRVTFRWPFAGGYHIFALDHEGYDWALVSGPSRNYLWFLAREDRISDELRTKLIALAKENDFNVDELIWVDHADRPDEDI